MVNVVDWVMRDSRGKFISNLKLFWFKIKSCYLKLKQFSIKKITDFEIFKMHEREKELIFV